MLVLQALRWLVQDYHHCLKSGCALWNGSRSEARISSTRLVRRLKSLAATPDLPWIHPGRSEGVMIYRYTARALEIPSKQIQRIVMNLPRKVLSSIEKDMAVSIQGRWSLLILAQ